MTIVWIVLAAIAAIVIALFQYGYLTQSKKEKRKPWFALLRAATVFCILLLLLAPAFQSTTYTTQLPVLAIAVDNSTSIKNLGQENSIRVTISDLQNDTQLGDRFQIVAYQWSDELEKLDSLNFNGTITDVDAALRDIQELHKQQNLAAIILTDGNQTSGRSYAYSRVLPTTQVYPVIYGDTTSYSDLSIRQLNANRYSFLNNEFPVEVFLSYDGASEVEKKFSVIQGNQVLYSENVKFSPEIPSTQLNFNLKSTSVGLKTMRATIETLDDERNEQNNSRTFAVEVIDQQTRVLMLAAYPHPDLGALKKAIESNEQRSVDIAYDMDTIKLADYNLVIMYGMNNAFAKAYSQSTTAGINTWVITGKSTDFNQLNNLQNIYQLPSTGQTDDVQPIVNDVYAPFDLEAYDYQNYPPVVVPYGDIVTNTAMDVLMYKNISGVETRQPFWFSFELESRRYAVTVAAGLWRWRAQSYLENKDFTDFDNLINSQIQYLASNKKRNRLDLEVEPFYFQSNPVILQAQYLDKNYIFDDDAVLNLQLKAVDGDLDVERPFVLSGNVYEVDLSGLEPGTYEYQVKVRDDDLTRSGKFEIIAYDIEAQAYGAHDDSFVELVGNEKVFYAGQVERLKKQLMDSDRFKPVQQARSTTSSLIDWKYLLAIVLALLATEWFLRKYNGLI